MVARSAVASGRGVEAGGVGGAGVACAEAGGVGVCRVEAGLACGALGRVCIIANSALEAYAGFGGVGEIASRTVAAVCKAGCRRVCSDVT